MSIESKHAYRFVYLKSDAWKNIRLEALVREGGRCQICGEESIYNDAHHIWYPENIYETKIEQLVILCRPCHDFIHSVTDCKTGNEKNGRDQWDRFSASMRAYRLSKVRFFDRKPGEEIFETPKDLREAYGKLRDASHEWKAERREFQKKIDDLLKQIAALGPRALDYSI